MKTISEMAEEAYPDHKIRLQKICYGEIQRQAYIKGATTVLEEIERAIRSSIIMETALDRAMETIYELKGE